MELNTPFYVALSKGGPNNTSHPLHTKSAYYREESFQIFKVIEVDTVNMSSQGQFTYLTEDGYCLWDYCTKDSTREEYEKERNIEFQLLIFN